jgi:hypothetical protein
VNTRRRIRHISLALVAVVTVSACASIPPAKRVAQDVVDTLEVSDSVKACMLDRIDEYSEDDLQDIAESADAGNTDGVADLARFERDLAGCTN